MTAHPSVYVQAGELAIIVALIFKSSALPKIQMYVCITFTYTYIYIHIQIYIYSFIYLQIYTCIYTHTCILELCNVRPLSLHTHTLSLPLTVTAALVFKSFAKADRAWTSSNCTGMVAARRR